MSKKTLLLRVLTVDDSPVIANRMKLLLGEFESVRWIGNAERINEALELISNESPHVVILDINLAHDKPRNGIDLLVLIKRMFPLIRVIMFTNLTEQKYRDMCLVAGADYFFGKSNDFDEMQGVIARLRSEVFFAL